VEKVSEGVRDLGQDLVMKVALQLVGHLDAVADGDLHE